MSGPTLMMPRGCSRLPMLILAIWLGISAGSSVLAQRGQITESQFHSWIFQPHGDAGQARRHLESKLELQVGRLEDLYSLDEDQRQLLSIAGQGDIHRFFNRVSVAQQKFHELEKNDDDFHEAYQIAMPLQQELMSGLFGDDSLFAKVLRTALDAGQLELMQAAEAARKREKVESYAQMCVAHLEMTIPITAAQREEMLSIVISQFDSDKVNEQSLVMRMQYGLFAIPDEKMEAFLDEGQIEAMRKRKAQLRGVEQMLRQQGLLDDDP